MTYPSHLLNICKNAVTLLLAGKFCCNFFNAAYPDNSQTHTELKILTNGTHYRPRTEYQTTTENYATGLLTKLLIFCACINAWQAPTNTTHYRIARRRKSKPKLLTSVLWLCHARKELISFRSVSALLRASWETLMNSSDNSPNEHYAVRWVTLDRCAQLVGYTKDALNALRTKGKLRMDIHWRKREGRIFIDMHAFQNWIETGR